MYGNPVALFSEAAFSEYVAGFGDENEEFWFGLQKLAKMTNNSVWELRVDLVDFEENTYLAEYSLRWKVQRKNTVSRSMGSRMTQTCRTALTTIMGWGSVPRTRTMMILKATAPNLMVAGGITVAFIKTSLETTSTLKMQTSMVLSGEMTEMCPNKTLGFPGHLQR
jgi:hypothetical protein